MRQAAPRAILRRKLRRDQPASDDGVAFVENCGLTRSHAVCGFVELQHEAAVPPLDARGHRRRAIAQLDIRAVGRDVQPPGRGDAAARERLTRTDDQRVRRGIGAKRVERRRRSGDAEALALPGRESPIAGVTAKLAAALVDDGTILCDETVPSEELAVVVAREEARLLALGACRSFETGGRGLRTRLRLRLLAERKPEPVEVAWLEPREDVRLVLCRLC